MASCLLLWCIICHIVLTSSYQSFNTSSISNENITNVTYHIATTMATIDTSFFTTKHTQNSSHIIIKHGIELPVFVLECVDIFKECIFMILFIYCIIQSIRVTSNENKTEQYKQNQILRFLSVLICICQILWSFTFTFELSNNSLQTIFQVLATGKDTLFGVTFVIAITQIAFLVNKHSIESCSYKLLLAIFLLLCLMYNLFDIFNIFSIIKYTKTSSYWQFALVGVGGIIGVILVIYYCKLQQYIKGEAIVEEFSDSRQYKNSFRDKMAKEYRKASNLISGTVLFFVIFLVHLVVFLFMFGNQDFVEHSVPYILSGLLANLCSRSAFCHYLWIRYDPVSREEKDIWIDKPMNIHYEAL
eukprot:130655_1